MRTRNHSNIVPINDRSYIKLLNYELETNDVQTMNEENSFISENQSREEEPMVKHIQSIHRGGKFSCDQCGKEFKRKDHLNTHILSVHQGVKFKCYLCSKDFSRQDSLDIHIQSVISS